MLTQNEHCLLVLETLKIAGIPVGAIYLSQKLGIPQTTVGRFLLECEKKGWVQKVSNKGRQLTQNGLEYLHKQKIKSSKMQTANEFIKLSAVTPPPKLIEVLEMRKLLEAKAAQLACSNATDAELEELETLMMAYSLAVKKGLRGEEEDLCFHMHIAKISKNGTLYNLLNLILIQGDAYAEFSKSVQPIMDSQMDLHRAICQAIVRRDADAAASLTVENLNRIIAVQHAPYESDEKSEDTSIL